jgi:hypothetical protein
MALSLILPAHVAASTTTDDPKYTNWTALILCQAIAIIITGSIYATTLEHDMAGINSFHCIWQALWLLPEKLLDIMMLSSSGGAVAFCATARLRYWDGCAVS